LPAPSLTRWIAEALIDHHRVIDKIRADIPEGSLPLENIDGFADQPIARGLGAKATEALKNMQPLRYDADDSWALRVISDDNGTAREAGIIYTIHEEWFRRHQPR
jgi:hypothetical protein